MTIDADGCRQTRGGGTGPLHATSIMTIGADGWHRIRVRRRTPARYAKVVTPYPVKRQERHKEQRK